MASVIHVAAAVIRDSHGRILIAKRPAHVHMGNLWEFPGGKLEAGESARDALVRELREELDIEVTDAEPLIQIHHDYTDKSVRLDVWTVSEFTGNASGREGQEVRWVAAAELINYSFPAANYPIVNAAMLPDQCFITGGGNSVDEYIARIVRASELGAKLFILRPLAVSCRVELIQQRLDELEILDSVHLQWHSDWFEGDLESALAFAARKPHYGVHFQAAFLSSLLNAKAEFQKGSWISASCHGSDEVQMAARSGLTFALLSPVKATKEYLPEQLLGWSGFTQIAEPAGLPVYALGGLTASDTARAKRGGAQGVAFVKHWWA